MRARSAGRASFETRPLGAPCISHSSRRGRKVGAAVADGSPGALSLLGSTSPLLSLVSHPLVPSARTVAGAARRARMRKDGTWSTLSESKDRLDVHLRPSGESFAVARD